MLYGYHQINGRGRPTEDRILIQKLLPDWDLFAVFDGHSGTGAVRFTMDMLPKRLLALLSQHPEAMKDPAILVPLLKTAFLEHDKDLARQLDKLRDSGTTASVALVTPTHIIFSFLGDSPTFVLDPTTGLIMREAGKHEPTLATETERIRAAGGTVEIDEYGTPRVDGALMVSRAFGDFSLKFDEDTPPPFESDWAKMKVTANPDVLIWPRPDQGVLAIMSDGLVETLTNALKPHAQVAKEVQTVLQAKGFDLQASAEAAIANHVMAATRGRPTTYTGDDLSLILVDVGLRAAQAPAAPQQAGAGLMNSILSTISKPKTRKARHGRRNRTGKKNRIVKILGF